MKSSAFIPAEPHDNPFEHAIFASLADGSPVVVEFGDCSQLIGPVIYYGREDEELHVAMSDGTFRCYLYDVEDLYADC